MSWGLRSVVAGAAITAVLSLGTSPAEAHDFTVVVVESGTAAAVEAGRGFRFAVDRSPDVSHPPGEDAGDHLGGVDVDIVSVQTSSPSAAEEVGALVRSGASAVVVLATGPAADAAAAAGAAGGKTVLAIGPNGADAAVWARITLLPAGPADDRRLAAFAAAFAEVTGTAPTDAATLGYDAGTLLDALVLDVGKDLEPGPALAAAAAAAAAQLVLAELQVSIVAADTVQAAARVPTDGGRAAPVLAATLTGTVVIGVAALAITRTRRRAR